MEYSGSTVWGINVGSFGLNVCISIPKIVNLPPVITTDQAYFPYTSSYNIGMFQNVGICRCSYPYSINSSSPIQNGFNTFSFNNPYCANPSIPYHTTDFNQQTQTDEIQEKDYKNIIPESNSNSLYPLDEISSYPDTLPRNPSIDLYPFRNANDNQYFKNREFFEGLQNIILKTKSLKDYEKKIVSETINIKVNEFDSEKKRVAINRYLEKRRKRNPLRMIKYEVRQVLAQNRQREKGKFVKQASTIKKLKKEDFKKEGERLMLLRESNFENGRPRWDKS